MSIESLMQSRDFLTAVRDLVNTHRGFAASVADEAAPLPAFAKRVAVASPSKAVVALKGEAPALADWSVPDDKDSRALVAGLRALVPVPSDADLEGAAGAPLDAADAEAIREVIRSEAVLRFVASVGVEFMPARDV